MMLGEPGPTQRIVVGGELRVGVGGKADCVAGGVAHGVPGRRALYAPLLGCLQVNVEPGRALRPYPLGPHGPDAAARIVLGQPGADDAIAHEAVLNSVDVQIESQREEVIVEDPPTRGSATTFA